MRTLLAALGAAALAPAALAAPAPASAGALAEQLGAPEFARREAAAEKLAALGADALPALDAAARNGASAEARARAATLAARARRLADDARRFAALPTPLDFQNVPLADAVAQFQRATGIPVMLDVQGVADPSRRVTVRRAPMPPWLALQALCEAAGVRERHRAEALPPNTTARDLMLQRRGVFVPGGTVEVTSADRLPILLADGAAGAPPVSADGAVRVAAMPPGFPGVRAVRGAGEVQIVLEVTPLPSARWQETVGVRVRRAVDADGRELAAWMPPPAPRQSDPYSQFMVANVQAGVVFANVEGDGRVVFQPNPRLTPLRLRTDDRLTPSLRLLEGVVVGEVTVPDQILVSLDGLSRRVGASAQGPDDAKLTLASYQTGPNGTTVRVRIETPWGWNNPRPARARPVHFDVFPNAVSTAVGALRFTDAAGRSLSYMQNSGSNNTDPFRQTQEVELQFAPSKDRGPPERLEGVGNKTVTAEVPFRLENVPLP